MDVRLPDGTIIRNVPEGATKAQIMAKVGSIAPAQESPPKPNQAAMNPEVHTPFGVISGETAGGFNPAAALIQAGEGLDSAAKGALDLVRAPSDWIRQKFGGQPDPIRQSIAAEREAAKQPMKDLQEVHPGSTTIGTIAQYVATPNKLAPVQAALEYGSPAERAVKAGTAYLGNKVGETIGQTFGRVAQPTRPAEIPADLRAATEAADRLGVKLTSGEATGNRALKWAEAASGDLPVASGIASRRHDANRRVLNAAALRQLGEKGDEITPDMLAAARARIGGDYERILSPARIELDNSFRAEVKAITGSKVMKELRDENTEALIGKFQNMPQGKISVTGEWFQQNKTALDKAINAAYRNGQPAKAQALERFEDALERAAMRSLPKDERAAFKQAQRQWATLRTMETGQVVDGANVMPGRLDAALRNRYGSAYKEGKIKGELADIASLASVLRPPPQSGSAPRAIYSGLMGGAAFAEPISGAMMLGAPAAFQAISPAMRRYMEKGIMEVTPEMERWLMLTGGKAGLLGALGSS